MDSEQLDLLQQANPALAAGRIDPLELARALRDAGTEAASNSAPVEWRETVDAAIRSLAGLGRPFTADDVRALGIGDPPSPKAWGARMLAASKGGVIRRVGYRPSTRASVHGHPIAVWVGAQS